MISRALTLLSTPIILALSIPLTLFALFTTFLAFLTLLARCSIIYAELLLAVLQSFLAPSPPSKPLSLHPSSPSTLPGPVRHHARRRTSSSSSTLSLAIHTPSSRNPQPHGGLHKPPSLASLLGTTTPRDYESVGGWRLTSADSDEEALWTGMNSRLELPALTVPSPSAFTRVPGGGTMSAGASILGVEEGRYHARSLTGGSSSRRGSRTVPGTASGSPELGGRRRGKGSGTVSPEGYFSGLVGQGLGMTGTVEGREAGSRRSSVSLVKVRGE